MEIFGLLLIAAVLSGPLLLLPLARHFLMPLKTAGF
jgi:hypothetical protein